MLNTLTLSPHIRVGCNPWYNSLAQPGMYAFQSARVRRLQQLKNCGCGILSVCTCARVATANVHIRASVSVAFPMRFAQLCELFLLCVTNAATGFSHIFSANHPVNLCLLDVRTRILGLNLPTTVLLYLYVVSVAQQILCSIYISVVDCTAVRARPFAHV